MRKRFTKMQGAGNDFIVLDATREPLALTPPQVQRLADRHFGIGADQILVVEPPPHSGADFGYRIFNSSGDEVEHCGNGARCFVRYVRDHGLTTARTVRVQTMNNLLVLTEQADGQVTVDMNRPVFDPARVPFEPPAAGVADSLGPWRLPLHSNLPGQAEVEVAVLSMGNPHAVLRVDDAQAAPVATLGPQVQALACFPRGVNVGFLQVLSRSAVALRVFERGAGETLACGTGACAAVVAGIRLGWLGDTVRVATRGGELRIHWPGDPQASVHMTGPAHTVFEGEIEL